MNDPIVKRVIAVEDQSVNIDFENGIVYVDNVALKEPFINELTHDRENFDGPFTVPKGCVFVMGDNRNHSNDSRNDFGSYAVGQVSLDSVLGKASIRWWPLGEIGSVYK